MQTTGYQIEGYVVVGDDDMICDAHGVMPASLKNDADWAFFQAGLDAADVCVLGRLNHEASPNPKRRRRLVLTTSVSGVERDENLVFWNPAATSLVQALANFEIEVSHLAIVGGQAVFDFFLSGSQRYTRFHLSRIEGVRLPNGRKTFSMMESDTKLRTEDVLEQNNYVPKEVQQLDEGVEVVSWG